MRRFPVLLRISSLGEALTFSISLLLTLATISTALTIPIRASTPLKLKPRGLALPPLMANPGSTLALARAAKSLPVTLSAGAPFLASAIRKAAEGLPEWWDYTEKNWGVRWGPGASKDDSNDKDGGLASVTPPTENHALPKVEDWWHNTEKNWGQRWGPGARKSNTKDDAKGPVTSATTEEQRIMLQTPSGTRKWCNLCRGDLMHEDWVNTNNPPSFFFFFAFFSNRDFLLLKGK